MKITLFSTLVLSILVFAGCQAAATQTETTAVKETKTESTPAQKEIPQTSVKEAQKAIEEKQDAQFIDVRTPDEFAGGHAVKAKNFPLDRLDAELAKLDKDKPVYVICQTGRRSQQGAEILQKAGFKDIYNITGGTSAWVEAGLPTEK